MRNGAMWVSLLVAGALMGPDVWAEIQLALAAFYSHPWVAGLVGGG